jgi:hypothetical protein
MVFFRLLVDVQGGQREQGWIAVRELDKRRDLFVAGFEHERSD